MNSKNDFIFKMQMTIETDKMLFCELSEVLYPRFIVLIKKKSFKSNCRFKEEQGLFVL